jgi:glycosyltransferase involved in cell wall biosynthesis
MYTPSAEGGHARYTWELMTALSESPRGNCRFELVTSTDIDRQFKSDQYVVHPILKPLAHRDTFSHRASWIVSRLTHYPRREMQFMSWLRNRPDITGVHFQEWTPWLAASMFRRVRAMGKQVYYTAHNILPHKFPRFLPKSLMISWIRKACLESDTLFVLTENLKDELSRFLGQAHPHIQVVPHGVWTVPHCAKPAPLQEKLAWKRLLCFGAIRENKGTDLLLRAMEHLPGFSVTIAGMPFHQEYFRTEIVPLVGKLREKGVRVDLLDRFIPDNEVPQLFASHSAIVLPYTRGFVAQSGVAFMALAYELPVVASEVGGLRDLFDQFKIGTTFSEPQPQALAAAVKQLYADAGESLVGEIQRARKRHSWQEAARATIAGYELAETKEEKVAEPHDCAVTTIATH